MNPSKASLPSQIMSAPTSSGYYTPEEGHQQLSFPRLFAALLRLKRLQPNGDIKIETSLDGSSEIYLKDPNFLQPSARSPSVHPSPTTGTPISIESLIQRLKQLAESQKELSAPTTPPYNLQVSLDNCTLFYIPADNNERIESFEQLPNSLEGQTPNEPYYNLTSPSTLKFIQQALLRKSDTPSRTEQEVLEKPIIILQPKGNLSKNGADSPIPQDISRPDLAEILKRKLEELKIEGDVRQAIDDENVQIITLNYSPCSNSGSISSKENSTPVMSRNDYPSLLSPKTNSNLIRKLHAVQEDLEGEDEGIRDFSGGNRAFFVKEIGNGLIGFNGTGGNKNPSYSEKWEKLRKRSFSY